MVEDRIEKEKARRKAEQEAEELRAATKVTITAAFKIAVVYTQVMLGYRVECTVIF